MDFDKLISYGEALQRAINVGIRGDPWWEMTLEREAAQKFDDFDKSWAAAAMLARALAGDADLFRDLLTKGLTPEKVKDVADTVDEYEQIEFLVRDMVGPVAATAILSHWYDYGG
jgi:hypothetical protein